MTNTYNTLNPLGSTSPKDLFDNASDFDDAMNSLLPSFLDRFGRRRETWSGMEVAFSDFLLASGYQFIGDYDAVGELTFTQPNQVMSKAGEYWRPGASLVLPYTTVNNWTVDQPKFVSVGDATLRAALAAANGVGLVTGATPQMASLASLKTWQGRYPKDIVLLLGGDAATPGRGDRQFWWNEASTVTANDFNVVAVTGVATGRWIAFGREVIRASDWGMYGDGTDITTKFASMMAYIAAIAATGVHSTVQFGAGDYVKSACPNLAIRGLVFEFLGEVTFTNTGTGPNLNLDGGALSGMKVDGFYIGSPGRPLTLRGGPTTGQAIYSRACVGDFVVAANVHGCGTSNAALRTEWAVLGDFYLNITPGDLSTGSPAWYLGGVPAAGVTLSQRLTGEQTSYCNFWNLKANGCGTGIYLESTLGNNFWGGDAEYSSIIGLNTTTNALKDKFWGMNFEVNPTDVSLSGNGIRLIACDAVNIVVQAASVNSKIVDCLTDALTIVSGAMGTLVSETSFSRGITGTLIVDNGTQSCHSNNYNMTTNKFQNAPPTVTAQSVTLPINWVNTTGNSVLIHMVGGTVGNLSIVSVGGGGDTVPITYPMTGRQLVLNGETVTATGSVNPTSFKTFKGA